MRGLETARSAELMDRATAVIPGGVNSVARRFDEPISFAHGRGSKIVDMDGNEYVDYLQAWGAIVLGHCHPDVNDAVARQLERTDLYGFGTTELEVSVAELVNEHVPSAEKVQFGVTGSEVVAHAIRLARAVTGRRKIVKFQGHFHGWYDPVSMNHLTDRDELGTADPFTAGILEAVVDETVVLPFNDVEAVERAVREHEDEIAAVVLEPVAHNMGCIPPEDGYLDALREITAEHDIVLIFDEIITGFRHDMGGVQRIEGVTPDLTTLGKSIANGYPISVLCGKAEYMDQFSTAGGPVTFGGTYNAQAGSLAAAKATMELLVDENFHEETRRRRATLAAGLRDLLDDVGLPAHVAEYGTVYLTYFMDDPPQNYRDIVEHHDDETYMDYRWGMIERGVLKVPKNVRRNYLTASHSDADVDRTLDAAAAVLAEIAR